VFGAPPLPQAPASAFAFDPHAAGALALNVQVWELFWRGLVYGLSKFAVVPLPWVAPIFLRWVVERIELPRQQRVSFTGEPGDIWWVFILYALCGVAGLVYSLLHLLLLPFSILFTLLIMRWFFANLAFEGQGRPLTFTGGYWKLLGWNVFFILAIFSIIGWAWVATAAIRWVCRHIVGLPQALVFNGSGWSFLWRILVVIVTAIVLIPIPWTTRWFTRWLVSELALVERT
jgi:hypothetical protein